MREDGWRTTAGHAGKPFILARTRSPTFHCWAAAAAAAAAARPDPFLRAGAMDKTPRRKKETKGSAPHATPTPAIEGRARARS